MKAVEPGDRIIANIHESEFEPFISQNGETDGYVLQLNREHKPGLDSTSTRWSRVLPLSHTNIRDTKNFCY